MDIERRGFIMSLDLKLAWKNIFNAESWKSKFVVYMILSIIVSTCQDKELLKYVAALIKNSPEWIIVSGILGIIIFICGFVYQGYDIKYQHDLIIKKDAELPKWEKLGSLFLYGLKPFIPFFLIGLVAAIVVPPIMAVLPILSIVFVLALLAFILYGGALYLSYSKSLKMWDILNFKQANKYIGKEYFKYIGIVLLSIILGGVLITIFAIVTNLVIHYNWINLVIIDILLGTLCAFFTLWFINMLAQVHHSCVEKFIEKEE